MELEKHITDEKTGISYTLCGDYASVVQSSVTYRNATRYC